MHSDLSVSLSYSQKLIFKMEMPPKLGLSLSVNNIHMQKSLQLPFFWELIVFKGERNFALSGYRCSLLSIAFRGGHLDHAHTGDCTKVS